MQRTGVVAVLLLCSGMVLGKRHAVLVAGSSGFENYRHQADICHAWQVLTRGGVRKENIVLMMYDDVAASSLNPVPGKLFNHPTPKGTQGFDVYEGCGAAVDYRGAAVTPSNFMAVLTGDKAAAKGGKVLRSGPHDDVFVNFVDHGGFGVIAFPAQGYLHQEQLVAALKTMHQKRMYRRLVFYLESCQSGSMFTNLPADIGVFATTAANATQSSWGTFCPPNDNVNGMPLGTCLGDTYSVNWMQNADVTDLSREPLESQYRKVKKETGQSTVMQFGDLNVSRVDASHFEGRGNTAGGAAPRPAAHVDSRDIPLATWYARFTASQTPREAAYFGDRLAEEVRRRVDADSLFAAIAAAGASRLGTPSGLPTASEYSCLRPAHTAVQQHCGGYTDYSLKYTVQIAELCHSAAGDAAVVVALIEDVCRKSTVQRYQR